MTKEVPVEDQGIIFAVETDEDSTEREWKTEDPGASGGASGRSENDPFFGPLLARFLTVVRHTGSMQTACRQLHISYTKGWKLLKEAEHQLGYGLLVSRSGGTEGGFSRLTEKGEDFLRRYLCMEEELRKKANGCLNGIFRKK
mgnify:CR=1 FL=1